MKKLMYYSDCPFFGGCENLLSNLIHNESINNEYDIFFVYRHSLIYNNEVNKRFTKDLKRYPMSLFTNDTEFYKKVTIKAQSKSLLIKLFFRIISKIFRILKDSGLYSIYNLIVLYRLFKKINPDIIHINNGGYPGALTCKNAVFAANLAGIKNVIFTINNLAYNSKSPIESYIDINLNKIVSYFSTASLAAKMALNDKRKFPLNKIINIPNTILLENKISQIKSGILNNYKNKIIVGSAGLLIKRKGFNILIQAVNFIKNDIKDTPTIFLIFGDGEERTILEDLIKEYKLENLILLMGHKDNILDYIKDFDIFVLPSIEQEDFPYVNIEAMILEKPIISTNVAGIPEQIENNENGYIVAPKDFQELGLKIKYLITNKEKRIEMGINSRKKYDREFSYEKTMNKYLDLYNSFFQKRD